MIGGSAYYGVQTKVYFNETQRAGMGQTGTSTPGLRLGPVRPNPFRTETSLSYLVVAPGVVRLAVYDVRGREVRTLVNAFRGPGTYRADFDAAGLACGIYLCRLFSGSGDAVSDKILLVR